MDTKKLILINVILGVIISIWLFPLGAIGIIIGLVTAVITFGLLQNAKDVEASEREFLLQSFLLALALRTVLAAVIFGFSLQVIFAPDATGYDSNSWNLAESWRTNTLLIGAEQPSIFDQLNNGLSYFIALIYYVIGRNPFAIQMISSVLGAACAPLMYFCARHVFQNTRVARATAVVVAVFPAMIIWSAQVLKDGFIVFMLVLGMFTIMQLQKRLSYLNVAVLLLVMVGIFTLRFYLFPILAVAAVGGFLIGTQTSVESIVRRSLVLLVIGVALSFFGVLQRSQTQVAALDLNEIERVRRAGSTSTYAASGFNNEANVSTVGGAVANLPIGLATLYAAPFPWQMVKITQILLLPEMVAWWAALPITFLGIWYCLKNRLRENVSILLFVAMLSLTYALTQGNLGTMYRQRTQIQVFLLMFTAVGIIVVLEKRENLFLLRNPQLWNRRRLR